MLGIKEIYIEDVREGIREDFVFRWFRANAVYEGVYLLGHLDRRPLISNTSSISPGRPAPMRSPMARPARARPGAFELSAYALNPDIKIIAPGATGRSRAAPICSNSPKSTRSRSPRTRRARRLSPSTPTSCTPPRKEKCWRDPAQEAPEYVHMRTISPKRTRQGDHHQGRLRTWRCRSIDGVRMSPATLLAKLNEYGATTASAASTSWRTFRRHEVARRLRDSRRHDSCLRPIVPIEEHHGSTAVGASEGRTDAALCRAHLLRLLVLSGARNAAGGDRQEPGACGRRSDAEALQGQCHGHRPRRAASRSIPDKLVTFEDDQGAYDQKDGRGFIQAQTHCGPAHAGKRATASSGRIAGWEPRWIAPPRFFLFAHSAASFSGVSAAAGATAALGVRTCGTRIACKREKAEARNDRSERHGRHPDESASAPPGVRRSSG